MFEVLSVVLGAVAIVETALIVVLLSPAIDTQCFVRRSGEIVNGRYSVSVVVTSKSLLGIRREPLANFTVKMHAEPFSLAGRKLGTRAIWHQNHGPLNVGAAEECEIALKDDAEGILLCGKPLFTSEDLSVGTAKDQVRLPVGTYLLTVEVISPGRSSKRGFLAEMNEMSARIAPRPKTRVFISTWLRLGSSFDK